MPKDVRFKRIMLVANDSRTVQAIKYPLEQEDYLVLRARDGPECFNKARRRRPDLVIVDDELPDMMGVEICQLLRGDPGTSHLTLLLIADNDPEEPSPEGYDKRIADGLLFRPFNDVELIAKVKDLLTSDENEYALDAISTGNGELDSKMGGGIPFGSLTLIEGDSGAGKSVLAQQIIFGCLEDGYSLTLFTSENSVRSLVRQMQSLSLDTLDYLLLDRFKICPVETSHLGTSAPSTILRAMKSETDRDMVIVDSLTSVIAHSTDKEVLAFFEDCKRMSTGGTTVIAIVHSHGLSRELIVRLRSLCDAHLQMRTEEVGQKLIKTLEVTKVRGAEQTTGNIVSFEVEPRWGMRVIPISKVKG